MQLIIYPKKLLFNNFCGIYLTICAAYYLTISAERQLFCIACFKGGESSSQFRWFTIAKIEL